MPTILAIDTSAKPVSCAIVQNNRILGNFFANSGLTHSQTLMPMIEQVLSVTNITVDQLDAIAVNAGPGSFTGVRIGVSAVKGLAFAGEIPCVSVSTLEAMAHQVSAGPGTIICGTMDARCQQVYTALFEVNENGEPMRLTEDAALSLSELGELLSAKNQPIILIGDGAELSYKHLNDSISQLILAPASVRFQNACGTAIVAEKKWEQEQVSAETLVPEYLRLPQAERELNSRMANK